MSPDQLSLVDWLKSEEEKSAQEAAEEKETRLIVAVLEKAAKIIKAARVARTMQLLEAVEKVWSAERLLTPVTMDTIMQLRRILYPPDGVLPK